MTKKVFWQTAVEDLSFHIVATDMLGDWDYLDEQIPKAIVEKAVRILIHNTSLVAFIIHSDETGGFYKVVLDKVAPKMVKGWTKQRHRIF